MTKSQQQPAPPNGLEASYGLTEVMEVLSRLSPESPLPHAGTSSNSEQAQWMFRVIKDLLPHIQEREELPSTKAKRIHAYLVAHLHEGPTLKDLAEFLGYSEKYCSHIFYTHMGESYSKYLKNLRLERATSLLRETHLRLTGIAQALGFSDQFAFSHFFKKAYGCSPNQFRTRSLNLPASPLSPNGKTDRQHI